MIFGRVVIILALAVGLGACATYYDDGVRYEDGSYYSPGDAGRGDYYYAPEPSYNRYYYDNFDRFFFDSSYYGFGAFGGGWYGSPIYSYGGYCSVRYRYCPYGYGYGYDDGYGYGYRAPPRHRHGNRAASPGSDADTPQMGAPQQPWIPGTAVERPRREQPRRDPMAADDGYAPEPRRSSLPRSQRSSDAAAPALACRRSSDRDSRSD